MAYRTRNRTTVDDPIKGLPFMSLNIISSQTVEYVTKVEY